MPDDRRERALPEPARGNTEPTRALANVTPTVGSLPVATANNAGTVPTPDTSYFTRTAGHYRFACRVLLLAALLFLAVFLLFFSRAFSYDSVSYFFKDIRLLSSFIAKDGVGIDYAYDGTDAVALAYRGGVANVGEDGVEIYAADGTRLLYAEADFAAPRAVASRKYVVAYDRGGTSFSVCSSYAELYAEKTERPIYGAASADSGHFALITGSDTTLSRVLLYDGRFALIQKFERESATVATALSENGKGIVLLGLRTENGNAVAVADFFRVGEIAPAQSLAFKGEVPLAVGFTDKNHFAVLTREYLRVFATDGKETAVLPLSGATPVAYEFGENGVALALRSAENDAAGRLLITDKKGADVQNIAFSGEALDVTRSRTAAWLLFDGEVCRVTLKNGEKTTVACERDARSVTVAEDDCVRVFYPATARIVATP